jgi:hypothetical protein
MYTSEWKYNLRFTQTFISTFKSSSINKIWANIRNVGLLQRVLFKSAEYFVSFTDGQIYALCNETIRWFLKRIKCMIYIYIYIFIHSP